MGKMLYKSQPVFREALDRCDKSFHPYLQQPLFRAMFPQPGDLDLLAGMTYTQPALFAIEVALAELWRSWGVTPSVVMGHSLGEYAAAISAGVFSLEDGAKLVAARGRLMDGLPQSGVMAAIFATEELVSENIRLNAPDVTIAVINGPTSIAVSGSKNSV